MQTNKILVLITFTCLVLGANAVDTDRILSKQSKRFKLKSRLVGESDFINQRNQ
jgi:hypothetical protein